eukprot:CAMPEP_0206492508 /NCGR_PEP_ID=MMETSP0324_2-20121206/46157_1 /ASSEMBLY_ACC=CAM_ASM_000836 /TAXON_ID=2866 /ORGANISM="Crypthecodinium cohnii, Strain Seligo" /LENGTH=314 /DNA_ID=CAMNT_0053974951 /DNA_START=232 /DNA_END=1174 /DNA_ORIENTATION=-
MPLLPAQARVRLTLLEAICVDEDSAFQQLAVATPEEINSRDDQERTALHLAAVHGHGKLCLTLLEHADFHLVTERWGPNSLTPLHLAAAHGQLSVYEALREHPELEEMGSPAYPTVDGSSALHCAAYGGQWRFCEALLNDPLFQGEWAQCWDNRGWTPLHAAASRGHAAVCEVLLTIQTSDSPSGLRSALHLAAAAGEVEVCALLLSHPSFEVQDAQDLDGRTAVFYASSLGHLACCKLLLQHPSFSPQHAYRQDNAGLTFADMLSVFEPRRAHSRMLEERAMIIRLPHDFDYSGGLPDSCHSQYLAREISSCG